MNNEKTDKKDLNLNALQIALNKIAELTKELQSKQKLIKQKREVRQNDMQSDMHNSITNEHKDLLENSISLLSYHLQYKDLMEKKDVNFHVYSRNRGDSLMNMVLRPQLKNWNFIYEDDSKREINKSISSVGIF
jgi:endonuclease IV